MNNFSGKEGNPVFAITKQTTPGGKKEKKKRVFVRIPKKKRGGCVVPEKNQERGGKGEKGPSFCGVVKKRGGKKGSGRGNRIFLSQKGNQMRKRGGKGGGGSYIYISAIEGEKKRGMETPVN